MNSAVTNAIPTEEDWRSEHTGIDWPYAYENFHGKTFDDTITWLADGRSTEDFTYMPARVFAYYFHAFAAFLVSDESKGACDAASAFICLMEYRLSEYPELSRALWPTTLNVLNRLAGSQEFYGANPEIYGSFAKRCAALTEAADEILSPEPV
jgi:hypothetical protein